MNTLRIQKEFKLVSTNTQCSKFQIIPEENIRLWNIFFQGPPSTPYEGGKFAIIITFTEEYPFKAPIVSFATKIYHPNVNSNGEVCMEILKEWKQTKTIKDILIELYNLLLYPNVNDPLVPDIANEYQHNIHKFNQKAKDWVMLYALED